MKKIVSVVLIMMFVVLAGCSQKETSSTGNAELDKVISEKEDYKASDYVTLCDYSSIPVDTSVTSDEIQQEIDAFVSSNSMEKIMEGKAKDGDTVNIDYEGSIDGVKFDGGTAQGADLVLGSGSFIPGFEEGLVGVEVGETVDVNTKFPDEYPNSPDLAGKEAVFKVTINYIVGEADPNAKFDDALVKKATNGEYKTADEYKEMIEKNLKETKKNSMGQEALYYVINNSTVSDYPEFLYDAMLLRMDASYKYMSQQYGYDDFSKFISEVWMITDEEYDTQLKEMAVDYTKEMLLYEAIAEKEGFEVTEEEYNTEITNYLESNQMETVEELKEYFVTNYASELETIVNESIIINKVTELLSSRAVEK
ncbi:MAG: trigger factor [Lachnospiraceae bacterium]|nr:trigger factor [Lachnospiraceae bacterium]